MSKDERYRRNRFRKAVPSLPVKDCVKALKYYCDVLGFKKDFDDGILGVERTLFAGVSRGSCLLILNEHDRQKCRVGITFQVDDVDLLHDEYLSRGAKILTAPRDEVWGARILTIADLYGHNLAFSSPTKKRRRRAR